MKVTEEIKFWIKLLKENIGWFSATVTAVVASGAFFIQINSYLIYSFLSLNYGLSKEFFSYNYLSGLSQVLILGFIISLIMVWYFSCKHLFKNVLFSKNKKFWKSDVVVIFAFSIILFGLFYIFKVNVLFSIIFSIVVQIVLYFIIKLFFFLLRESENNEPDDLNATFIEFKHGMKIMPIIMLFTIIITGVSSLSQYASQKNYKIVLNKENSCQAIIYTTKDYYLTLDCAINDKNLTLYRGTETKIATDNVKTKQITFDNVHIKLNND